jgi:uncharacterized lipoprotein YmbA
MKRPAHILTFFVMAIVLAGCASSSPSHFYTLSSSGHPAGMPQTDCYVSVGPISVPSVVDRPQIVVRTGPNQVFIDEFERWASPLKEDILRVVAENLVSALGTSQVTVFSQSTAADASYRVLIDILRFESEPDRAATLDALWTVNSRKAGESRRTRTTITEPTRGSGYAEVIAAHSRALGRLSDEIALTIREMDASKH